MNTHQLAGGIASLGRGPDSMLMHVSPREVAALGSMLPSGSLPINPQTGLPEAGIFDALLPIGATILGASFGMPWLGAAASGVGTWARTGDLGAGLMAGLGSYGMGQLLGAAGTFGAESAASEAASQAAMESASGGVGDAASGWDPKSFGEYEGWSLNPEVPDATPFADMPFTDQIGAVGKGLSSGDFWSDQWKNNKLGLGMAGVGALGLGSQMMGPQQPLAPGGRKYGGRENIGEGQIPREVSFPGSDYVPGKSPEYTYFRPIKLAKGGIVDDRQMMGAVGGIAKPQPDQEIFMDAVEAIRGESKDPDAAIDAFIRRFGADEFERLIINIKGGQSANAGGDGQSDSIPASVDGNQPAQLSEGEYVIPSDAVSDLGNGSSEAGGRQLDQMVERIRRSRGRSGQPPAVAPMGLMPA